MILERNKVPDTCRRSGTKASEEIDRASRRFLLRTSTVRAARPACSEVFPWDLRKRPAPLRSLARRRTTCSRNPFLPFLGSRALGSGLPSSDFSTGRSAPNSPIPTGGGSKTSFRTGQGMSYCRLVYSFATELSRTNLCSRLPSRSFVVRPSRRGSARRAAVHRVQVARVELKPSRLRHFLDAHALLPAPATR